MSKFLYIVFVLEALISCNTGRKQSDEILQQFDSVVHSLEKTNERVAQSTSSLYDSVAKKYSESFLRQFRYSVSDTKSYLQDLKRRFKIACGDSTGSTIPAGSEDEISISTEFFLSENGPGKNLPLKLKEAQDMFSKHTTDIVKTDEAGSLTLLSPSKQKDGFLKAYFYNTPPVAVLSILSKFENDLNRIENKILQEYLRK